MVTSDIGKSAYLNVKNKDTGKIEKKTLIPPAPSDGDLGGISEEELAQITKNKEKLKSNDNKNENVVLYTENMTVSDLANRLGVASVELVKKLFSLGIMATANNSIDFDNASILVLEYNKELKKECLLQRAKQVKSANARHYLIAASKEY